MRGSWPVASGGGLVPPKGTPRRNPSGRWFLDGSPWAASPRLLPCNDRGGAACMRVTGAGRPPCAGSAAGHTSLVGDVLEPVGRCGCERHGRLLGLAGLAQPGGARRAARRPAGPGQRGLPPLAVTAGVPHAVCAQRGGCQVGVTLAER